MLAAPPPLAADRTPASVHRIGGSKNSTDEAPSVATRGRLAEPDAELLRLGREFERAWATERAIPKPPEGTTGRDPAGQEFDRAVHAAVRATELIVDRIAKEQATTFAGVLVKSRAASWCRGGEPIVDMLVDAFACSVIDLSTDCGLVVGILRDLEALQPDAKQPDAELIALGRLFEAAWAVEKAAWDVSEANESDEAASDRWEAAGAATRAIVDEILKHPATTLAGLVIKARACSWCHSDETIDVDFFSGQGALDERLAASVLRDLLAVDGRVSPAPAAAQVAA